MPKPPRAAARWPKTSRPRRALSSASTPDSAAVDGLRLAGALSRDAKNLTNRHRRARDAFSAARRERRAAARSAGMRANSAGLRAEKRRAADLLECVSGDARRRPVPQYRRVPDFAQLRVKAREHAHRAAIRSAALGGSDAGGMPGPELRAL